jgi:hypothetical protein
MMHPSTVKLDTDVIAVYAPPLDGRPPQFSHFLTRLNSGFGRYCTHVDLVRDTRQAIISKRVREIDYAYVNDGRPHVESDVEEPVRAVNDADIELGPIGSPASRGVLRKRHPDGSTPPEIHLDELHADGTAAYEWDMDLIEVRDPYAWQNYIRYMACHGSEGIITQSIRDALGVPSMQNMPLHDFIETVAGQYQRILSLEVLHEEMLGRLYQFCSRAAASQTVAHGGSVALDMSVRTPSTGYALPGYVPDGDPPTAQQALDLINKYIGTRSSILESIMNAGTEGAALS